MLKETMNEEFNEENEDLEMEELENMVTEETEDEEAEAVEKESEEADVIFVGTVINCGKLNLREKPSLQGKVICELNKGTELMVDRAESTDEWYKVYLESGLSGFCMKDYIGGE